MKRQYNDYLLDIVENCDKATRFLRGVSFDAFVADEEKRTRLYVLWKSLVKRRVIFRLIYGLSTPIFLGAKPRECATR